MLDRSMWVTSPSARRGPGRRTRARLFTRPGYPGSMRRRRRWHRERRHPGEPHSRSQGEMVTTREGRLMSSAQLYDTIGATYTVTRRTEPRIAARIWAALADARTVLN